MLAGQMSVDGERLKKAEFSLRSAFPTQLDANFVIELVQVCGDQNHGGLQGVNGIKAPGQVCFLCADAKNLEGTMIAGWV
jgi:hypothetical protein